MKGIILAGGTGSRLFPMTLGVSKQLLPVAGKPLIYYPLSTLMLSGIREILIISTPVDLPRFGEVFGNGSHLGLSICYAEQLAPNGIAEALLISKEFVDGDSVALILGDNVFYGAGLSELLSRSLNQNAFDGAVCFTSPVAYPESFGVVEYDEQNQVISIEEKPVVPRSRYALTGLYAFDRDAYMVASQLSPSVRGELEVTDVLSVYLNRNRLCAHRLDDGHVWFDTGTHESLAEAHNFITNQEAKTGLKIGCVEEIALSNGWIELQQVHARGRAFSQSAYGQYLQNITG